MGRAFTPLCDTLAPGWACQSLTSPPGGKGVTKRELFDSVESEMQNATKKVDRRCKKATNTMQEHLTKEVQQGVEWLHTTS
jgi:hypothetical protein